MLINFLDPTPLTKNEAILLVLGANMHVDNDYGWPMRVVSAALMDLAGAAYFIRKEAITEKIGRLP